MRRGAITSKSWSPSFKSGLRQFDVFLLAVVFAMVFFGLIMVYSSSFIFAQERAGDGFLFIKKQSLFALLGIGALYLGYRVPYRKWMGAAYWTLGTSTLLLACVAIPSLGVSAGGAQRWISLGFLNFQPAELTKFSLVLFAAYQLTKKKDRLDNFKAGVLANFFVPLPALVLLLMQPDFGTVFICGLVMLTLMALAGVPLRFLFLTTAAGVAGGTFLILMAPYRLARVTAFLDPWSDPSGKGFQILQSLTGLHYGRLFGVGLGNGKQKLFFLPEAHNDFIFSVIGEELGFFGVALVVCAFSLFIYRGFKIASKALIEHQDHFGFMLATGITLVIGFQAFINMAVAMGMLPTKGLVLPFISAGGTALMVNLFCVGVLLNISSGVRNRHTSDIKKIGRGFRFSLGQARV